MLDGEAISKAKEADLPVARDTLPPPEEDELKKVIFAKESEALKSELGKEEDGEEGDEEIAIGDTLKRLESKKAVEDELESEVAIDCEIGEWGKFGKCDKLCDGGQMKREREVLRQPRNGGAKCPELSNAVECNTESCASEAYQRRATRRKLTAQEKARESMANKQKIALAMKSASVHEMMKRTREVMRKVVHTQVATVKLPGEVGERSAEAQVRKSLKEAMAKNAVDNAMKTYEMQKTATTATVSQSENDDKEFKKATQKPIGAK